MCPGSSTNVWNLAPAECSLTRNSEHSGEKTPFLLNVLIAISDVLVKDDGSCPACRRNPARRYVPSIFTLPAKALR